jgi:hypothetical protein
MLPFGVGENAFDVFQAEVARQIEKHGRGIFAPGERTDDRFEFRRINHGMTSKK